MPGGDRQGLIEGQYPDITSYRFKFVLRPKLILDDGWTVAVDF